MLGTYMFKYLMNQGFAVVAITRNNYDLSLVSKSSLKTFLTTSNLTKQDVVINCAGVIPQASKQRMLDKKLYLTINSLFPIILGGICDAVQCKFIHITTDCVFCGSIGGYTELSVHDETNDYGISKSLGELCEGTIIRTSIIGEESLNKRSLLEWVLSNKNGKINGYTNHYWNGLTCLQLSKIVYQTIQNNMFWNGVRHIYSPESVSKYELVQMISDTYDLNIVIDEHKTSCKIDKTIVSVYNTNKKFDIPSLDIQIQEQMTFKLD